MTNERSSRNDSWNKDEFVGYGLESRMGIDAFDRSPPSFATLKRGYII